MAFLPLPHLYVLLHGQLDNALIRILAFLDRTNIGNAKVDGLQQDLKMTNGQYNATLTIFFVSYAVFEPLTNVLLKKMRPSIFLPVIMVRHTATSLNMLG